MRKIEEDQRPRDGHMRADSRQPLLISPQHTRETATLLRARMIPAAPACSLFVPKLVLVLVGIATRGPRPRMTFCGGPTLNLPRVKL
jgi:hypothetical protein